MCVQTKTVLDAMQNNTDMWESWKVRKLGVRLHTKMIH